MLDFFSAIAPGKAKVQRRTQAIVALATIVGAMILARSSGNSTFSKEVLKTIATAIPANVDSMEKKPRR